MGNTSEDRQKSLETALAQINKQFGAGSVGKLGEKEAVEIETVSTGSLAVDLALGVGGLPKGRVVEIYGPESSGKTLLTLHAISEVQKEGGIAAFVDAEHALDPVWASKIGVDVDNLIVSQPDNGEQALEIIEKLVRSRAIDLIVVDSVAALVPSKEIEGDMGDSHMGLQARLMSQGLRKITGVIHNTNTTVVFINQLRSKIGVMFGCFQYSTRVQLADGTTEKIGKIVNQKKQVEVLSYNPETRKVEPRKIVNWFDNGNAEKFLQFKVENYQGSGFSKFAATENHQIATPHGYESAGDLKVGDEVNISSDSIYTAEQVDLIKGGLLGDGSLRHKGTRGVQYRMGHGAKQVEYLDWKASHFSNISQTVRVNSKGDKFVDLPQSSELYNLWEEVYGGRSGSRNAKTFSKEYFASLTPKAWALYLMDDGSFDLRTEGKQVHTAGGSGRISFCVDAMTVETQVNLHEFLKYEMGVENMLNSTVGNKNRIDLTVAGTRSFMSIVGEHVHPSMSYKLLPAFANFKDYEVAKKSPEKVLTTGVVTEISVKPETRSMRKFDIEVEGNHNYFAGGVMVHNSPETTTGGNALKYYASVRMDIRRISQIKEGDDIIGARTRVKVVKNKVAAPFKQAEFDILFKKGSEGFSREADIRDLGVHAGIVKKSGAWFTYGDTQLGQGAEKTRVFLKDNPDVADEIETKIKAKILGNEVDLDMESDPSAVEEKPAEA